MPDLEFVVFTDIDQRKDAVTRKKIRSHAMRDFKRKTKKSRPDPQDVYLAISPLLKAETGMATRTDPFNLYPMEMDDRKWELIHHGRRISIVEEGLVCFEKLER